MQEDIKKAVLVISNYCENRGCKNCDFYKKYSTCYLNDKLPEIWKFEVCKEE